MRRTTWLQDLNAKVSCTAARAVIHHRNCGTTPRTVLRCLEGRSWRKTDVAGEITDVGKGRWVVSLLHRQELLDCLSAEAALQNLDQDHALGAMASDVVDPIGRWSQDPDCRRSKQMLSFKPSISRTRWIMPPRLGRFLQALVPPVQPAPAEARRKSAATRKIGRASCRERV